MIPLQGSRVWSLVGELRSLHAGISQKKTQRDGWRFWWRVEHNEHRSNFLNMIQKTPFLSPFTLQWHPGWELWKLCTYMLGWEFLSIEIWYGNKVGSGSPLHCPSDPGGGLTQWLLWSSVQVWRERWTRSCRSSWPMGSTVNRAWRSCCTTWPSCGLSWPAQVGVPSWVPHLPS